MSRNRSSCSLLGSFNVAKLTSSSASPAIGEGPENPNRPPFHVAVPSRLLLSTRSISGLVPLTHGCGNPLNKATPKFRNPPSDLPTKWKLVSDHSPQSFRYLASRTNSET